MATPKHIDFATLVRPGTANTFLMAPKGLCERSTPDTIAPTYPVKAAALRRAFLDVVLAEPRVTHTSADERGLYDDLVARSRVFRFPDLVSVKFLDLDGERSTLALYARAVYGLSDMGVNRARSLGWISKLNGVIKPHNA